MRDVLKDASVSSILIAIVGLVLLLMPSLTNRIIVYGIGGVLAVYGIGRIFRYVRRSAAVGSMEHDLSAGIVDPVEGPPFSFRRHNGSSAEVGTPQVPAQADVLVAPPHMGPYCRVSIRVLVKGETGAGTAAGMLLDQSGPVPAFAENSA